MLVVKILDCDKKRLRKVQSIVFIGSMNRHLYASLVTWKQAPDRVPLILRGARQVGKSYLLKAFGRHEFSRCHHFDFEKNGRELIPLFADNLSPQRLVDNLSLFAGVQIDLGKDLVILDEIQNCPAALTSLKYFAEDMPELFVCAAGSLLGITLTGTSFPVGKVCYLDLYPLSFSEFILNLGDELLLHAFEAALEEGGASSVLHSRLWDCLKEYYVVGGMPRIVAHYVSMRERKAEALFNARKQQTELLETYRSDFSKHSGKINALHIASVFENIPVQLASVMDDSVQRYRFKDVLPGKKGYASLTGPIDWLEHAGLVYRVPICQKAQLPLKSFTKANIFKLYLFDVGLLGCMLDLQPATIMLQDYGVIKGFFAENFVASELVAGGTKRLYSWSERNSEIEFLLDIDGVIVPVEVKSGTRTKAQSLRQYLIKYDPKLAVMVSGKTLDLGKRPILQIPLYDSGHLVSMLRRIQGRLT